jgi:predicted membrane channel-forming protein YqfA (hemolysin III family)
VVTALETWVFGAVLAVVGFLITGCSFMHEELGVSFLLAGLTSVSVGSIFFVFKFKQWIEQL